MARNLMLSLMVSSLFLTNCSAASSLITDYPFLDTDGDKTIPVTLLFSDEKEVQLENTYYDALINIQQNYPENISGVNVVTLEEKELIEYYNIETYPTLIFVDDMEEQLRIEGEQEEESIYNTIISELVLNNNQTF